MVYDPQVWHEWHDDHRLGRQSLVWIREHAEPGDLDPIVTAIAALREVSGGQPAVGEDRPPLGQGDGGGSVP